LAERLATREISRLGALRPSMSGKLFNRELVLFYVMSARHLLEEYSTINLSVINTVGIVQHIQRGIAVAWQYR
jgi:hypothetical protein